MTLCIGALASYPVPLAPCIVLGFDYKAANDSWGSESEYKFHALSDSLVALYSGSPGRAKELAALYREYLTRNQLELHRAVAQLREPVAVFKKRLADSYVMRRFGFSYEQFLQHGEQWLGTSRRDHMLDAIEKHDMNVQMIVAGFIGAEAVLFRLGEDIEFCTNFAVIGTGAYTAEPALHARAQSFNTTMALAIYNVYEAKKVGESSPFVGQKTRMFVLRRGALPRHPNRMTVEVVSEKGKRFLEKLYRKHGPKPVVTWPVIPDGALQMARWFYDDDYRQGRPQPERALLGSSDS